MRVLLLNAPVNIDNSLDYEAIRPPYGLAMISSILKRDGWGVSLWDAQAYRARRKEILNYIKSVAPDIIGIGSYTFQLGTVVSLIDNIKSLMPNILTVVGGPHVSAEPELTLKSYKNIDFVVIGEGEKVMLELVESLNNGNGFNNIDGLAFRKDGGIIVSSKQQPIDDLDSLPYADWESLPMGRYWDSLATRKTYGVVFASRGCPYVCTFCAAQVTNGRRLRKRSSKNFVGELAFLNEKYNIDEFLFCDSTFNFDKKWVAEICEDILRMKNPITWRCTCRADCLDRETVKLMKRSGCIKVLMGIESADPQVLKLMKKGESTETIIEGLSLLKELKLSVDPSFIIGMPGDTESSIAQTIELAKRIAKDANNLVGLTLATPLPGTELYDQAKKEGLLVSDWTKFDSFHISYVPKSMTKEQLQRCYRKALREIYFNLPYLIKRLFNIRSLHQLRINIRYALRVLMRGYSINN